jgi:hypothetical protein
VKIFLFSPLVAKNLLCLVFSRLSPKRSQRCHYLHYSKTCQWCSALRRLPNSIRCCNRRTLSRVYETTWHFPAPPSTALLEGFTLKAEISCKRNHDSGRSKQLNTITGQTVVRSERFRCFEVAKGFQESEFTSSHCPACHLHSRPDPGKRLSKNMFYHSASRMNCLMIRC